MTVPDGQTDGRTDGRTHGNSATIRSNERIARAKNSAEDSLELSTEINCMEHNYIEEVRWSTDGCGCRSKSCAGTLRIVRGRRLRR